jgi:hypothetical protein
MAIDREKMVLAGFVVVTGIAAFMPASASDVPDKEAVIVNEDGRLEYALHGQAAPGAPSAGARGRHCRYLAPPGPGEKTVLFRDGNKAVFSANRIQFLAPGGAKKQIEGGADVSRKDWWCQADGLVLFESVQAPDGRLAAVKVEWFDTKGARNTVTRVNVPPHGENADWSYAHSRLVDECLGMTFRVSERGPDGAQRPPRFVEYKLCPTGI